MVSALLIQGVPVECINHASVTYFVPAKIIVSVLKTERGQPGLAAKNSNGTEDLGPMQINTSWLKHVEPYGYTRAMIQYDPCVNVLVGTWILSRAIADGKGYWDGVGDYHSHTKRLNVAYQHKVREGYAHLLEELGNAI